MKMMTIASMQQSLRALRWPGLLGLAALALAALLELGLTQRWQAQSDELQATAERLQRQLRLQRASGAGPEATLQSWQLALPDADQRQQRHVGQHEDVVAIELRSQRQARRHAQRGEHEQSGHGQPARGRREEGCAVHVG